MTHLKNEWRPDITDAEYHANEERLGSSGLKILFTSTPKHYKKYREGGLEVTEAMELGSTIHDIVFYPEKRHLIRVAPKVDKRTKIGKETIENWRNDLPPNAIELDQDDADSVLGVLKAIQEHPKASKLFSSGKAEVAGYYYDPKHPMFAFKIKPDFMRDDGILVDLKTARDVTPRGFARSVIDMGYLIQAAMYSRGYEIIEGKPVKGFVFVAVEKTEPFDVACYQVDEAQMELGNKMLDSALNLLARCSKANKWPGVSEKIETLQIGDWAFKLAEEFEKTTGEVIYESESRTDKSNEEARA